MAITQFCTNPGYKRDDYALAYHDLIVVAHVLRIKSSSNFILSVHSFILVVRNFILRVHNFILRGHLMAQQ